MPIAADTIVIDFGSQTSAGNICAVMISGLAFDGVFIGDRCVETGSFDLIYLWNLNAVKKLRDH